MLIRLAGVAARKTATMLELWHADGLRAVIGRAKVRLGPDSPLPPATHPSTWLRQYRPTPALLDKFRRTTWPADAPTFTVIVPVYNTREDWLRAALDSVLAQTYPRWQLVCVNDASPAPHIKPLLDGYAAKDDRVTVLHLPTNRGVTGATNAAFEAASGEYVCFLDHDDVLEPHALHRLAKAVLSEGRPGLLYTDEAVTESDVTSVGHIRARPQFSHDYYLSHPYFVHLIAMRRELVRRVGGMNEQMKTSHDVDLVLRVLEVTDKVTHVPDVLYLWRTHPDSLGHQTIRVVTDATVGALTRHLARTGRTATVQPVPDVFNVFDVRFPVPPNQKVAILIPTKNQVGYVRKCVESLEATTDRTLADIIVIDHASDDPATLKYLDRVREKHRVVPASGPFNFSAIMNTGVRQVKGPYTHYLFLNNDTVAPRPGWLEHMLGFGCRPDVGVVGSLLIYPDDTVQHAGVIVGMNEGADHAFRTWRFAMNHFERHVGDNCGLVSNRDYSAVTAACMLMRTEVFDEVGGFDEKLAVGFNDTDLCLRVKAAGYKVIQDNQAVLIHYESKSRGYEDKHPTDTALFRERYADLIRRGDPFFNPQLERSPVMDMLKPTMRCPEEVTPRTVVLRPAG
jgi:GT2 family glycosyltransferase